MCKELIDSKTAYNERIADWVFGQGVPIDAEDIDANLDQVSDDEQYKLDCAMWYGYINASGSSSSSRNSSSSNSSSSNSSSSNSSSLANPNIEACKRLFMLLCHGGLLLRNKQSQWQRWSACGIPICAAVSHGGAILVQIPKKIATDFVEWFKGDAGWGARTGTHGIIYDPNPEEVTVDLRKFLTETRESSGGEHRGINLGMGGIAQYNPFSGNHIAEDGSHGHLYFYFDNNLGPDYAGMLIKCEDSAPPIFSHKLASRGQAGHMHLFGSSGKYSCTGGKKWASHSAGPGYGEDNMFIPLDPNFMNLVKGYSFANTMIGSGGASASARSRTPPLPACIYNVKQWQAAAKQATQSADLKEKVTNLFGYYFDGIEPLIAAYHNDPSNRTATANKIANWCTNWLSNNPNDAVGRGLIEELQRRANASASQPPVTPPPRPAKPTPGTTTAPTTTATTTTTNTTLTAPITMTINPTTSTTTATIPTTTTPPTSTTFLSNPFEDDDTTTTTTTHTMTTPASPTPTTPTPASRTPTTPAQTTTTPGTSTSTTITQTTTPPGTPTPTTPAQTPTPLTILPNPFNEDADDQKPSNQ
jgi:Novel toxin 11